MYFQRCLKHISHMLPFLPYGPMLTRNNDKKEILLTALVQTLPTSIMTFGSEAVL